MHVAPTSSLTYHNEHYPIINLKHVHACSNDVLIGKKKNATERASASYSHVTAGELRVPLALKGREACMA
jgi:hypothetical protein